MTDSPRNRLAIFLLLWSLALTSSPARSNETEPAAKREVHEAMEVGGRITVDGRNNFHQWENTSATLGQVELSAKVHVHENMEGAITLLSQDDLDSISIDHPVEIILCQNDVVAVLVDGDDGRGAPCWRRSQTSIPNNTRNLKRGDVHFRV